MQAPQARTTASPAPRAMGSIAASTTKKTPQPEVIATGHRRQRLTATYATTNAISADDPEHCPDGGVGGEPPALVEREHEEDRPGDHGQPADDAAGARAVAAGDERDARR